MECRNYCFRSFYDEPFYSRNKYVSIWQGRFAFGLELKFGFNLAKRQVFVEQKLDSWCVGWVLFINLGFNLCAVYFQLNV